MTERRQRSLAEGARPEHPMRASILLVTGVALLVVVLAVASTLG